MLITKTLKNKHNIISKWNMSIGELMSDRGVFGVEQIITPNGVEYFAIHSPFSNITNNGYKHCDVEGMNLYEVKLRGESFLTLNVNTISLMESLNDLSMKENEEITVQYLFYNTKREKIRLLEQYEQYLNGIESPSQYRYVRMIFDKLNKVTDVLGGRIEYEPIPQIEDKLLDKQYYFSIRILTNVDIRRIESLLYVYDYFNSFEIEQSAFYNDFINRVITNKQILSQKEIKKCLLSGSDVMRPMELEKPINQQTVIKTLESGMILHNAIQLMPYSERKNLEVDKRILDQINKALIRVGIVKKALKVLDAYQGSTLLKVQMSVPPEINYTSISKKLVDFQSAMGNKNICIEIGDKPDTINIFIPLEERGLLFYRTILESDEFQTYKKNNPLPFILGENVNGGYMFSCLSELRHLLVTGATGSGKSVFVNLLLMSLLLCVPPDELSMYLIDPKQVEFRMFGGFPQVKSIITDMKKAQELLSSVVLEMEKRYTTFANSGVKNIASYNKNNEKKMPYIVCAVDEYADLVMVSPEVERQLVRLGQKARAAGIHLIICTQKPLTDIVTSVLKSNLPSAISFRLKAPTDYITVFGRGIPYNLLGKGDGVAKLEGQMKEYERFQSPLLILDEEMEEELYSQIKGLFKGVEVDNAELEIVKVEEPIDKLRNIIATSGELRVVELAKLMGIGSNTVHGLLQELLAEGWLAKPGRSYEINVSEEELAKWKVG